MAKLELERGTDVLLLETGDALLLEFEAYMKALSDTLTIADSILKAPGLIKADSVAVADAVGKLPGLIKTETVNIADSISKAPGLIKADSFAIADTIVKAPGLIKADSFTVADAHVKAASLAKDDTVGIFEAAEQLGQYYNTGFVGASWTVFGVSWHAQTFTPINAHIITSVKLLLRRVGSPGIVTVSIRATDGSGQPTLPDLCSGSTNGNTLPGAGAGEWRTITLDSTCNLSADIKYAIVVRVLSGNPTNYVVWRRDATSPTYLRGNSETSADSGSTWTTRSGDDNMFEEWGRFPPFIIKAVGKPIADTLAIGDAISKELGLIKADSFTIADSIIKAPGLIKTETITIVDVISKAFIKPLSDTVTIADSILVGLGKLITLSDTVIISDTLVGVHRVKTWLRQQVSRMDTMRMTASRMNTIRMAVSRMPLIRYIIRRFTA